MMKRVLYLLRVLTVGLEILSRAAGLIFSGRSGDGFFEAEIVGHE